MLQCPFPFPLLHSDSLLPFVPFRVHVRLDWLNIVNLKLTGLQLSGRRFNLYLHFLYLFFSHIFYTLLFFNFYLFFWDRVILCCPGWSAVTPSWSHLPVFRWSSHLRLLNSWDYRQVPPYSVNLIIFFVEMVSVLPRLLSNSWAQAVHQPWPPKMLRL